MKRGQSAAAASLAGRPQLPSCLPLPLLMLVLLTSGLAASGTGRMLGLPQEPACGPEPARAVLVFKCGGGGGFFFF